MFTLKLEQSRSGHFKPGAKISRQKKKYARIEAGTGLVRSWLFPREVISKLTTRASLAEYASINISSGKLKPLAPLVVVLNLISMAEVAVVLCLRDT